MRVKVAREDIYIPQWRGNRDLPDEEQIKIEYSLMTAAQEEKFSELQPKYVNEGDQVHYEVEVRYNINAIWDECVKSIKNFIWDDGKKEIPVTDPKKIQDVPGIYDLITEVVAHIKRGITEDDRKN